MRKNKYKNKKCFFYGLKFDSIKERDRYIVLKSMQNKGEISGLEMQPRFFLQESFKYNGKTVQKITYKADFRYIRHTDYKVIIEDVKGFKTEPYILRSKMLMNKIKDDESVLFIET